MWQRKPSYLVWTVLYTNNRFDDKTMDLLREWVGQGIKDSRLSYTLHREFSDRFMSGPW